MRALLLAAVGLAAFPASAQTFRLVDPALTVGGTRVGIVGAPLVQEPFGVLSISVPSAGVYRVSTRPFEGARPVGQFDGDGLYFAVDGQSVRLRSAGDILDAPGPTPAYVRFDALAPGLPTRGLGRVSVADAPGSAARSSASPVQTATLQRGPTSPLPTTDARAEADALRDALARAMAERTALAAERDRLRAERDASRTSPGWSATREDAYTQAVARADILGAEAARLRAERDELAASRDRATAARALLAAQLDAARIRTETTTTSAQSVAAQGDVARLRADTVARDGALAALGVENEDRRVRLAETDAELARSQRALVAMTAERDVLVTERDAARRDLDVLRRGAPATADRAALDLDRASVEADRVALAAARARFDADRAAAAQNPAGVTSGQAALLADRRQSLDALAAVQRERDALLLQVAALQAERDRLTSTVDRLTSDLAAEQSRPAPARPERPARRERAPRAARPVAIPTPTAPTAPTVPAVAPRRGTASFPGFDMERLANPDVVRRRLDEAEYPYWASEGNLAGDVLVLLETDASGRVIRTAVATPIGGGLDGLAESLVRDMQFVPPVVSGQRTGLRSQVLVRFER